MSLKFRRIHELNNEATGVKSIVYQSHGDPSYIVYRVDLCRVDHRSVQYRSADMQRVMDAAIKWVTQA